MTLSLGKQSVGAEPNTDEACVATHQPELLAYTVQSVPRSAMMSSMKRILSCHAHAQYCQEEELRLDRYLQHRSDLQYRNVPVLQ